MDSKCKKVKKASQSIKSNSKLPNYWKQYQRFVLIKIKNTSAKRLRKNHFNRWNKKRHLFRTHSPLQWNYPSIPPPSNSTYLLWRVTWTIRMLASFTTRSIRSIHRLPAPIIAFRSPTSHHPRIRSVRSRIIVGSSVLRGSIERMSVIYWSFSILSKWTGPIERTRSFF